jgi:hypothetical protein
MMKRCQRGEDGRDVKQSLSVRFHSGTADSRIAVQLRLVTRAKFLKPNRLAVICVTCCTSRNWHIRIDHLTSHEDFRCMITTEVSLYEQQTLPHENSPRDRILLTVSGSAWNSMNFITISGTSTAITNYSFQVYSPTGKPHHAANNSWTIPCS